MSQIILRDVTLANHNREVLIDNIMALDKVISIVKYNGDEVTGTVYIEVEETWIAADDTALDLVLSTSTVSIIAESTYSVSWVHNFYSGIYNLGLKATINNTWWTGATLFFRGLEIYGGDSSIAKCQILFAEGVADVRLRDLTNDNIICEKLALSSTLPTVLEVVDMGVVSNLPEKPALFGLEIKVDGSDEAYIGTIELLF